MFYRFYVPKLIHGIGHASRMNMATLLADEEVPQFMFTQDLTNEAQE
jgi:hypothetical protein